MRHADLDLLKGTLEAKLAALGANYDKRADIVIQQTPDALDQVQLAAERTLAVSLLNRELQMSRRLKGALQRMDEGIYGTCLACEEPISVKRLQAVPWAELCLGCQERSDMAAAAGLGADAAHTVELEVA